MENYSVVIFILAIMIILSAVADKIRLPYPVLLISAGIGIGFIPTMPDIELNPEVIAVVILGLGISRFSNQIFPDQLKNQSKSFWDIIIFLLNGLIFILIGLQFPYVLKNIDKGHVLPFIIYAFLINILALLLRMMRVFSQQFNLQKAFQGNRKRVTEETCWIFRRASLSAGRACGGLYHWYCYWFANYFKGWQPFS